MHLEISTVGTMVWTSRGSLSLIGLAGPRLWQKKTASVSFAGEEIKAGPCSDLLLAMWSYICHHVIQTHLRRIEEMFHLEPWDSLAHLGGTTKFPAPVSAFYITWIGLVM